MSPLRSLLWKEYRDYRWPALLCTAAWVVADITLRQTPGLAEGGLAEGGRAILFLASILLAVFIATQVIAGERSAGTERTIRALPLSPLLLTAVKIVAFAILHLPGNAGVKVASGRGAFEFFYALVTSAIGVYAWTLFLAGRARSRGSVIMHGLVTVCASAIVATFAWGNAWFWWTDRGNAALQLLIVLTPASLREWELAPGVFASNFWILRSVTLAALFAVATFRIAGAPRRVSQQRGERATRRATVRPPLIQSRAVSLVWKSFREARTLAVAVIAFNIFFAGLMAAAASLAMGMSRGDASFATAALAQLPALVNGFWNVSGAALAIALGLQIIDGKLRPRAVAFWHSRPLTPIAYLLTHMLMAFTVLIVGTLLFRSVIAITPKGPGRIYDGDVYIMSRIALSLQLIVLPATMLIATFVRSALAAVSLATALLFILFITGTLLWQWKQFSEPPPLQAAPIVSMAVLISALLSVATIAVWMRRFPAHSVSHARAAASAVAA